MTDTYVENILVKAFCDSFYVCEPLLVKRYFIDHSAELSDYATTSEEFYKWYQMYINLPDDQHNEEDDLLIKLIKASSLNEEDKVDEYGDIKYENFPTVAFPNVDFERPKNDDGLTLPWYELYFINNEPLQIEVGTTARSRWSGILQVNICVPKTWGKREVNNRYDEIATLFRSGNYFDGVRIIKTYRTSALDDDDYYCTPITVSWWADLDR